VRRSGAGSVRRRESTVDGVFYFVDEPSGMTLLIYGAYGYTGELIAEEAVERGLETVVAGRNEVRTEHLGRRLDCENRSFEAGAAEENLDGVDVN
jgi:short subunit dehydrogenase-like uncharacterized protein